MPSTRRTPNPRTAVKKMEAVFQQVEREEPYRTSVESARRAKEKAEAALHAAIIDAHEQGVPLRRIAEWARLSHQRIHQIVQGARQGAHQPEGEA